MDSLHARRGQSASGAAILVAIIGGLLVLYILFLPPAEREQMLFADGGGGASGGGQGGYYGGQGGVLSGFGPAILLTAVPGTLRLQQFPIEEHNIPSAAIFTSVQTQELKSIDSALVKAGVFSNRGLDMTFEVPDGTMNYLLSFNIDEASSSPLRVLVNGQQLFERPIARGTPPPIALPNEMLVPGTNTISFSTEGVGLAFWSSNTYFLSNILVSADSIDTSGSTSQQSFSLTEREILSMDAASLQFVPECDPRKAGRLTVQLNSRIVQAGPNETVQIPNTLYTGYVDCGVLFKTDVPPEFLLPGSNMVMFASEGGQYIVDRIKLVVELPENDYPVYYVNIDPGMFDAIDQGMSVLRLTLSFADYRAQKNAEVVINGFAQSFQTQEIAYQALIDPAIITPGPNTVQIIPHVEKLDVAEIRVELI